jgi:3-deoxy-7-phosphoheptulonate synthase
MLVRLRKNLAPTELTSFLALATELGLAAQFLDGEHELVRLTGEGRPDQRARLEDCHAVRQVLDPGAARELHQRAPGVPDRVVRVGEAAFGGGQVSLIAGPCAVELPERALQIAREVRARGATVLRGGAFKPRTSPYSFQGSGRAGLEVLARVRRETGLAVVTEALDPRDVEAVGEAADMFQVGSRNMANQPLLRELGQQRKPVLLKRGFAATLREFLLAAEFVLDGGNEQVVLCERGIRSFDTTTRNVLDVGGVAWLKLHTHLPVIVDPSHAAGRADLVRALARAGLAAGADGLICEVHPDPGEVHSDGAQAIGLEDFSAIAADARALAALDGRTVVQPGREAVREPTRSPAAELQP